MIIVKNEVHKYNTIWFNVTGSVRIGSDSSISSPISYNYKNTLPESRGWKVHCIVGIGIAVFFWLFKKYMSLTGMTSVQNSALWNKFAQDELI